MSASKFHAARVRTFGPKAAAVNGNGYTQAGGVSSALMVKSDLLAQGGQVGGRSSAIYVIPDRFGRAGAPSYGRFLGEEAAPAAATGVIVVKEVGPGDSGDDVKLAAKALQREIARIGESTYRAFDAKRATYAQGTNQYFNQVPKDVESDGVFSEKFSLQVGIFQRYMKEQETKPVEVTGVVDKATWALLAPGATVTLKPKPKPSGGGGYTPVKGQGDVTPPSTPFYQKPWFMPAAIGVGVLGVVGAIILWPSKKAEQ